MRIAPDTNVLARAIVRDDPRQAQVATDILERAEVVVLSLPVLCELIWVLLRVYRKPADSVASAIRTLVASDNVEADDPGAIDAGLAMLDAGGDFADGVIAYEGMRLGAEAFVSFDRTAVRLLAEQGQAARLLD